MQRDEEHRGVTSDEGAKLSLDGKRSLHSLLLSSSFFAYFFLLLSIMFCLHVGMMVL